MGNLTLAELRDSVKFHVQNSSKATSALLDRAINATYWHLSRPSLYQHRELRATVAFPLVLSTDKYGIDPTTMNGGTYKKSANASHTGARFTAWINAVYWETTTYPFPAQTQHFPLMQVSPNEMDRDSLKAQSEPRRYTIWDEKVEIDCYPSSSIVGYYIQLRGYVEPAALVAAGDVTVLGADWDDVLVVGAAYRLSRAFGEFARAGEFRVEFGQLLADMVDYEMVEGENDELSYSMHSQEVM